MGLLSDDVNAERKAREPSCRYSPPKDMDEQVAVLREAVSLLTRSKAPQIELWEREGRGDEVIKPHLFHRPTTFWTNTWAYRPLHTKGWMVHLPHFGSEFGPDTIPVFLGSDAQLLNARVTKPRESDRGWRIEYYAHGPGETRSRLLYVYASDPPAEFAELDIDERCPVHGEYHPRWDRDAAGLSKALAHNFV